MGRPIEYESIDDAECLHETAKAILVRIEAGKEYWVPKSVVSEEDSEVNAPGDVGTLVVQKWFAEKEGLS